MRLQLTRAGATGLALVAVVLCWRPAAADDKVDFTTTWFQEQRKGGLGGLTVIHPQFDFGVDAGDYFSFGAGYTADVVSGATASIFRVDAISTATKFSDTRHEGHMTLGLAGSRSALSVTAGAGTERDYNSLTVSASGNIYLPGKNTNVALSYTHNSDQVCDRDNSELTPFERHALTGADPCDKKAGLFGKDRPGETIWRDLNIDTSQATVTQDLSPTMIGQITAFGQVLHGFQSNPYRRVEVGTGNGDTISQEHVPDVRARVSVTVRFKKFIKALRAAVQFTARGYSDTWGVDSGTFGMSYSQYVGRTLLVRLRARLYQQTEAKFYKDAGAYLSGGAAGEYFTGDRELSRVRNIYTGAKLSYITAGKNGKPVWGLFDQLRFNLKGDVLILDQLRADDMNANPFNVNDQFINGKLAIVLQVGLLLRY